MSSFLFISATSRIISFDLISPLLHFTASVLQHFIPKLATVPSNSAVGYLNNEVTPNTMNISCATFRPVGDEAAVLGDLKANDTFAFLQDTVQTLNGNGGTEAMYTYLSETAAVAYEMYGLRAGWYDYNELLAWDWVSEPPAQKNTDSLPYGKMFIIQSGYEGAALVYSGEVIPAAKEFMIIPNTMNMLGNATPVDLVLGDIACNDTFAFLQDTVQTLNGNGGTKAMYTYLNETAAVAYEMYGLRVGWYDYNELLAWDWVSEAPAQKNDVEIPAGYGFIVQSGYDGAGIIIPSPLAD